MSVDEMEEEIDKLLASDKKEEARLMMHEWAKEKVRQDEEKKKLAG